MHQTFKYFLKLTNCSRVFYEKAALMNILGKHLWRSLFYSNVSRLRDKERLPHRCFPVSFTKYFRTLLLQNTSRSLLLLNTLFCPLRRPQPKKKVSFQLGYFKYFWGRHCKLLANSSFVSLTRGGRERGQEVSPAFFENLEAKYPNLKKKNALIVIIYGNNFSFKTKFLRDFYMWGLCFSCCRWMFIDLFIYLYFYS